MNIIVATDLSDGSVPAARWGFDFAGRREDAGESVDTHLVHAVQARYPQVLDFDLRLSQPAHREEFEAKIAEWLDEQVGHRPDAYASSIEEGQPEQVLRDAVDEHDAEWLAVGMTGRGALARMVVGSTAEEVAHRPPCNLVIAHPERPVPGEEPTFVVGLDFTDASARAIRLGAELVRTYGGKLRVVHVVEPPTYEAYPIDTFDEGAIQDLDELIERMRQEVDQFVDDLRESLEGIDWQTDTVTGYPTNELVRYAEDHDVDGLVMGTAGRTAMGDFLMGSVSRGVVKHMPCSVYLTEAQR